MSSNKRSQAAYALNQLRWARFDIRAYKRYAPKALSRARGVYEFWRHRHWTLCLPGRLEKLP